jgi:hypothetical protein
MPFNGTLDVTLYTGIVEKNVYIAEKRCVFVDEYGKYYLERYDDNNSVDKIYVSLGIMTNDTVEVMSDEESLKEMTLLYNTTDIFATTSKTQDEKKGTEDE